MTRFTALAIVLAIAPHASAQVRVGAAAESAGVPVVAPVGTGASAISPNLTGLTLPTGSISLSVAPAPSPAPTALQAAKISAMPSALVPAITQSAATVVTAKGVALPSVAYKQQTSEVSQTVANPLSPRPTTRAARASILIQDEVASWGPSRRTQDVVVEGGRRFAALAPLDMAASASERDGDVPVPPAKSPAPNGAPRLTKALVVSGFAMIGVTVVSVAMPALLPAAVVAYKGAIAWVGLATLTASRFTKTSEAAPDAPRGPPSDGKGVFGSFKGAWVAAKDTANAQATFEKRVGGFSLKNFRDWALGALRTGTYWMGPALMLMLGGAAAAKGVLMFGAKAAVAVAPAAASATDLTGLSMGAVMGTFLPLALAAEAAGLAVFFIVEKLAQKLGAGKAASWIGALAALGVAAFGVLSMTTTPFVVISTLALEAGVIWTAARSRSFASAMALRGILTAFSLSAAVLASWLNFGVAGALVGLPAVWGGVVVGGLALLAWKLKAPGLQLANIREWWTKEEPGQAPKNPWRILTSGLTWGLVVYAIGDLTFWGVNFLAPGHEPAPAILAKMLTAPVVLVLYNFVLVGLLEEFIFRRGLFKWMNEKFDKIKALTANRSFWAAAIVSALIFSGVHYIDWGAVLAKIGMGDPAASSGLGGAYDFSWAGFVARSVLGVVLAWLYKRSGLLLIPIVAHFWADSMEGLGLRWGFPAFIALAAGAMIVSFLFRPKSKPS